MHPLIFKEFDRICAGAGPFRRILEIGVDPAERSLLTLPSLARAGTKIGIDLEKSFRAENFSVLKGDANQMDFFRDGAFDLILCNSMLEHNPRFWLTLREIRRVTEPGALLVFGVPGFSEMGRRSGVEIARWLARLPWIGSGWKKHAEALAASTPTLGLHAYPGDYYRFSEQAVREIFLEGLVRAETKQILDPPRMIGWGFVPET
jgi:SAM-dependent methyltransferase